MNWAAVAKAGAEAADVAADVVETASNVLNAVSSEMSSMQLNESNKCDQDTGAPLESYGNVADMDLPTVLQTMWDADENRLVPGTDYKLDLQGYTHFHGKTDYARRPLFEFVSEDALSKPTYVAFVNLLDNYEREVGEAETLDSNERQEIAAFLSLIMETKPMQLCHQYLVSKGFAPESVHEFRNTLYQLWFRGYASTRGGPVDSSGFEHVFVGEEKDQSNQISGMHNWLQLYREEAKGLLDYRGYISHNRTRPDENGHILTMQFAWHDAEDGSEDVKPMSTSFIGVSPEYEIALYTLLCLVEDEEHCTTERGKQVTRAEFEELIVNVNLVVWGNGYHSKIRTAYPEECRD